MISNEESDKRTKEKINSNPLREMANDLADEKSKNKTHNIEINGEDTHIPFNLPTALIGDKGSGKTTLIKSLMKLTYENGIFQHIFFIYSPLTWDEELPGYITRVDVNDSDTFLATLFESKAIYNSYFKFFKSLDFKTIEKLADEGKLTEEEFTKHMDNNIVKYNKEIYNTDMNPNDKLDKIITVGEKLLKAFSKPFKIGNIFVPGFRADDLDAIIIDDVAIAAKYLFRKIRDNPLYEYLTLTRHMRLFILFSGQQVEQIPKTMRREIMCWMVSKNTTLELLRGVLTPSAIDRIEKEQERLEKYHFVVYNCVDGSISIC